MSANYGRSYGAPKPVPIGKHETLPATRDRSVPVRKVVCPTCGAQVGELCVSATGKRVAHRERRRRALREGL